MSIRRLLLLGVLLGVTGALVYGLNARVAGLPPLHVLLDPADGLYRTARQAVPEADTTRLTLPGLDESVTILRDERHVPHIFAPSDRAATIALGYVAAKDRLFQLDFLPRVASGRLAEAFGPQAVSIDRFLRQTGMEWGAQQTLRRLKAEDGIGYRALRWYGRGVNAYLDRIDRADLPLEFRLLGYTPDRYRPIQGLRLLQYMAFDLTYNTDDPAYTQLRRTLPDSSYRRLYPDRPSGLYEPIVPPAQQLRPERPTGKASASPSQVEGARATMRRWREGMQDVRALTGLGPHPTHGSNNWAVTGGRSATGAPLLAGDMHLSLTLPAIWYEAHVVTPTMNAYGLTIPGAPVLIQAHNRHVGWTLTNTGADQIDHYALTLDSSCTRYRYEGEWRPLRREIDTIRVNREEPVLDTLHYSQHGPVQMPDEAGGTPIALRWTAHEPSTTLRALWRMNRADSVGAVTEALRDWDTPMQNVLYAGTGGTIAIRSAGHLPTRRSGDGRGLLDGTTDAAAWTGRVPFDSLPAARNPAQGYLASANQAPTGSEYPYYLGHDWPDGYRSLRINELLRSKATHDVADFRRYQADVQVQQRGVFVPLLDGIGGLSARADTLRRLLRRWDGEAALDRPEPLVLRTFLRTLRRMVWDEPVFAAAPDPEDAALVDLLRASPQSRWLDVRATEQTEDADALLARALEVTVDTLAARHGWAPAAWRWRDHHELRLNHLTGSAALRALGRGPFEYPGFAATLSPGRGRTVTHSASQRVIIDFSTTPPTGIGVYPGGQSGRPLDPYFYDAQLPAYLNFEYFDLRAPASPAALPDEAVRAKRVLAPPES